MGLDLVEYVIAVENAFEIALPNDRLNQVRTPRDLAELVTDFVDTSTSGPTTVVAARGPHRLE